MNREQLARVASRRPTLGLVGEAGPEAIIPLHRSAASLGMLARTASALGASVDARGGTNISCSPVITINATGDVAQAVKQAMRESHGDLIRRMKRAKREDFRLAIV
jgi:phage-related minor tail protein